MSMAKLLSSLVAIGIPRSWPCESPRGYTLLDTCSLVLGLRGDSDRWRGRVLATLVEAVSVVCSSTGIRRRISMFQPVTRTSMARRSSFWRWSKSSPSRRDGDAKSSRRTHTWVSKRGALHLRSFPAVTALRRAAPQPARRRDLTGLVVEADALNHHAVFDTKQPRPYIWFAPRCSSTRRPAFGSESPKCTLSV